MLYRLLALHRHLNLIFRNKMLQTRFLILIIKQHLNSMQLPEKALSFANKLLTHYPITSPTHTCSSQCHSHSPQSQTFQPFQHMHDHRKERQIYDKPTTEKLENMRYFKQMGNASFKEKKFDEAAYFYQKAIIYSDYTFPEEQGQLNEMEILVQQSNMNMAICLIKKDNWSKAIINLREAAKGPNAEKDPKLRKTVMNTRKKSHYWMTKYYISQGKFQQANKQIEILEKLEDEGEVSVKQEAAELRRQVIQETKRYSKNSESISKKMFDANP